MIVPDLHPLGRWLHIGSGFAAVALGVLVMLLPKFGRRAVWHRRLGRLYATLIAATSLLGAVLAYRNGNAMLTTLGIVTFVLVLQGWRDARLARSALVAGDVGRAVERLRWHIIRMGASYIGAWGGFFANNPIFGGDAEWKFWFYVVGPSLIGGPLIARAALRVSALEFARMSGRSQPQEPTT